MPLQPESKVEFNNSAENVNNFIETLIAENIFDEKLKTEFVIDCNGDTHRVRKILELSNDECEKYPDIKFLARTKEKPENAADFAVYSLKEFKNSKNKAFFIYNRMLVNALLAIDKGRTLKEKRLLYHKVAIQDINTRCIISHQDIIVPITTLDFTYDATAILKNVKSNIDRNLPLTDPGSYSYSYLPLYAMFPNRALGDLIMANHINFIKNKSRFFLNNLQNSKNSSDKKTARQDAKKKIANYLDNIRANIEISKSIKTDIKKEIETLNKLSTELTTKKRNLAASENLKKYHVTNPNDYHTLKKELTDLLDATNNRIIKLRSKFWITLFCGGFLAISLLITSSNAGHLGIISGWSHIIVGFTSALLAIYTVWKAVTYTIPENEYRIIAEISPLLNEVNEILKLQRTIELTQAYHRQCETIVEYIDALNLNDLENAIPVSLKSNSLQKSIIPSPASAELSSSSYLLESAKKSTTKQRKNSEIMQNFKEEEPEEKKEKKSEVIVEMSETDESSERPLFKLK